MFYFILGLKIPSQIKIKTLPSDHKTVLEFSLRLSVRRHGATTLNTPKQIAYECTRELTKESS